MHKTSKRTVHRKIQHRHVARPINSHVVSQNRRKFSTMRSKSPNYESSTDIYKDSSQLSKKTKKGSTSQVNQNDQPIQSTIDPTTSTTAAEDIHNQSVDLKNTIESKPLTYNDKIRLFFKKIIETDGTTPDPQYIPKQVVPEQPLNHQFNTTLPGRLIYSIDSKTWKAMRNSDITPAAFMATSCAALALQTWDIAAIGLWGALFFVSAYNLASKTSQVTRISVHTGKDDDRMFLYPRQTQYDSLAQIDQRKIPPTQCIDTIMIETKGWPLSARQVKIAPIHSFKRLSDMTYCNQYITQSDVFDSTYNNKYEVIKLDYGKNIGKHILYVDSVRDLNYFNQVLARTSLDDPQNVINLWSPQHKQDKM